MSLAPEDREILEDMIFDAQVSAEKYLETKKNIHERLLEMSLNDSMGFLREVREDLHDDPMTPMYKLHMLVPLQTMKLIEIKRAK